MLPSYIIQDRSDLNGCVYDCRPRYWYSDPQLPGSFFCNTSCLTKTKLSCAYCICYYGHTPPYIGCYDQYKKEYRISYYGSNYDVVSFDIYGNIQSYGGNTLVCNIEACCYCFNGEIVKYFMRCGNYLMTSSGCVYCTHTICRLGNMQEYLNRIGDPKRCNGCLFYGIYGGSTYCYCVTYRDIDTFLKLFQFRTCNYYYPQPPYDAIMCNVTFLHFSLSNSNIFENIICNKFGCCYYWRDVTLGFCKSYSYQCGIYSTGDIVEYDDQYKIWYGLVGSAVTYNSSSNTTTYLMIGDTPNVDKNCIYNNCITTIKKVIAIPNCVTCNCVCVSDILKYNCIQKKNEIYNINGSWTIEDSYWYNCSISIAPLIPISINMCNLSLTTILNNYCFCSLNTQSNDLYGFNTPIFIIYTPRNTFSVVNFINCVPCYGSMLKFYEYSCCWTPISGCCFGINVSTWAFGNTCIKPKYIYDDIEDSFLITFHRFTLNCVSEPTVIKLPTCTGLINQMIRSQKSAPSCAYYCAYYYSNNSLEMSCCLPIICKYDILCSNMLCGNCNCCCGYITDICLRCSKPNINVNVNVSDCIYCMITYTPQNTSRYCCYSCIQNMLSTSQIDNIDCGTVYYGARNRNIRYLPI